jgi:acyl-CoA thioesterase-1
MLFLAVLLIVLIGCGQSHEPAVKEQPRPVVGAGEQFNPGGPAAAPDKDDQRRVMVAFGDSLTAGYGVEAGLSYPDYLQKKIDAEGLGWRVVNAGISGETTAGGLNRVSTVVAMKPEVIVFELGGNDGLRGMPLAQTRENLDQILTELKKTGAKIVLGGMTLPPNYGRDYVKEFESIYKDLAKKHQVKLMPFFLQGVFTLDRRYMLPDGIHANAEGNRIVADNVWKLVKDWLK